MKRLLIVPLALIASLAGAAVRVVQDQCGPFADVSAMFCPYVLEAYYTGISAGTSATTFSPDIPITRGQAAVFATKALNQALARGSRRAALGQWWTTTPHYDAGLGFTAIDKWVGQPSSDGVDVWVPTLTGTVSRVRASDGRLVETWSAPGAAAALCAMGQVFVLGQESLYSIDPRSAPGPATVVVPFVGRGPYSLAFDGDHIWTTNPVGLCACDPYPPGSISIVTPGSWTVQTVDMGDKYPRGIVFDGTSMWVTLTRGGLERLDSSGAVIQTVSTGAGPMSPVFDGTNIWVPNYDAASVTVVRAASGEVVATLTGNGLGTPASAAFDGSRLAILSESGSVSLWNAQDLTPLGNSSTAPFGGAAAISDGINFWLTLSDFSASGGLGRF